MSMFDYFNNDCKGKNCKECAKYERLNWKRSEISKEARVIAREVWNYLGNTPGFIAKSSIGNSPHNIGIYNVIVLACELAIVKLRNEYTEKNKKTY